MVSLKIVLIVAAIFIICMLFIMTSRRRKPIAINVEPEETDDISSYGDSYDIYNEIKTFIDKQMRYIMEGDS